MSVNPGFGGQKFIPAVLPKIEAIKEMIGQRPIKYKSSINQATAPLVQAAATVLVAGTAFWPGWYDKMLRTETKLV